MSVFNSRFANTLSNRGEFTNMAYNIELLLLYYIPQNWNPNGTFMGFSHLVLPTFLPDSKRRISWERPSLEISQLPFSKNFFSTAVVCSCCQLGWGRSPTCQTWAFQHNIIRLYGIIIKMSKRHLSKILLNLCTVL